MPYDSNLSQAGTEIDAVQMRAQFNGFKDLIDALSSVNAAQIDAGVSASPAARYISPSTSPKARRGPREPTGEVSLSQLATASGGTSSNSNAVDTLELSVGDPPTQLDVQAVADKLDELINALRR